MAPPFISFSDSEPWNYLWPSFTFHSQSASRARQPCLQNILQTWLLFPILLLPLESKPAPTGIYSSYKVHSQHSCQNNFDTHKDDSCDFPAYSTLILDQMWKNIQNVIRPIWWGFDNFSPLISCPKSVLFSSVSCFIFRTTLELELNFAQFVRYELKFIWIGSFRTFLFQDSLLKILFLYWIALVPLWKINWLYIRRSVLCLSVYLDTDTTQS